MPVSAANEQIREFVFLRPVTEVISCIRKCFIGMVVIFAAITVRADNRRGADEHFEVGIALENRALQPGELIFAPDGFLRPVGHGVGGAVQPALHHPDLQSLAPADCAVRRLSHGNLLSEDVKSFLKRDRVHPFSRHDRPIVVAPGIVIIDLPIARNVPVELDVPGERIHSLPMVAGQRNRSRPGRFAIEVNGITRGNQKIEVQFLHGRIDVISLLMIEVPVRLSGDHAEGDILPAVAWYGCSE